MSTELLPLAIWLGKCLAVAETLGPQTPSSEPRVPQYPSLDSGETAEPHITLATAHTN